MLGLIERSYELLIIYWLNLFSFFILQDLCRQDEFYCPSGKCILVKSTCNGYWDCYDGSDEPGVCKISSSGMTGKQK